MPPPAWLPVRALYSSLIGRTARVTEGAFELPLFDVQLYVSTGPAGEEHRADADLDVVLASEPHAYLTYLRARLALLELDEDLVLAATDGPDLGVDVAVADEVNATCPAIAPLGSAPPAPIPPRARGCAVGAPGSRSPIVALLALALGWLLRGRSPPGARDQLARMRLSGSARPVPLVAGQRPGGASVRGPRPRLAGVRTLSARSAGSKGDDGSDRRRTLSRPSHRAAMAVSRGAPSRRDGSSAAPPRS